MNKLGGLMKKVGIRKILFTVMLLFIVSSFLFARALDDDGDPTKKLDHSKYHNVGNIWLRVSNYGFFGSGNDGGWPSLEYPGGSGIDFLYQGALWFGAKKIRRNQAGQKLYWRQWPNPVDENDCIPSTHVDWNPDLILVVDTLTSVGFDGDLSLYELLPAYNELEAAALGGIYNANNAMDSILNASIRKQRRGIDDDGDGKIDEDPVGYAFPFRKSEELPPEFQDYGSLYPTDFADYSPILDHFDIWYPRGFVDLSDTSKDDYLFTAAYDDDGDGLRDEDGSPVSEQDFISYYYDYSPFPDGFTGIRHLGSSTAGNKHYPLNIRVRQSSYQWSFEYIKNLVYVEFSITNMNPQDTLYDCVMGVYMDCDIGPQAMGGSAIATDDLSGYVSGEGFEFAYSYDSPGGTDGNAAQGLIGARVCSPDPEQLDFACWFWAVGQGPDDSDPRDLNPTGPTANQKYWLLSGRNPDPSKYANLREENQVTPMDTRFLFGFFGDQQGIDNPSESSWNLAPGRTMKIVIAVFPGDDLEDLKRTSLYAKSIYGISQTLTTVVEPDIFPHYQAYEPPPIPNMYGELANDGKKINVYWDNRSEMDNLDTKLVEGSVIGWQTWNPELDSYVDDIMNPNPMYLHLNQDINSIPMPEQFWPQNQNYVPNEQGILEGKYNATVNPWTGFRLRHDFQGYALYGRSGSGNQEHWMHQERWDRIDTDQDFEDFLVNEGLFNPNAPEGEDASYYVDYGIADYQATIDKGLPNPSMVEEGSDWVHYYKFDDLYRLVPYEVGDTVNGYPLYDHTKVWTQELYAQHQTMSHTEKALYFKNPNVSDNIYLALYDEKLIPLPGFSGQSVYHVSISGEFILPPDEEKLELQRIDRLSRRYYESTINNPPRGIEYYVAVTAWDRGMPQFEIPLPALESGRDENANMRVFFPGTIAKTNMDNIFVTPNPYVLRSKYDGRIENDKTGDKSRRIWFANLPEKCTIRIYTLAGDLVDTIHHNGANNYQDIVTPSKAISVGLAASGIAPWNLLSRYNQIIAPGVYLYSVEDDDGNIKVDKFVIIKIKEES
jgi:hypothetical protein